MSVMYVRDENGNLIPIKTIRGPQGETGPQGPQGEAGGYYKPVASLADTGIMLVEWVSSAESMPALPPQYGSRYSAEGITQYVQCRAYANVSTDAYSVSWALIDRNAMTLTVYIDGHDDLVIPL